MSLYGNRVHENIAEEAYQDGWHECMEHYKKVSPSKFMDADKCWWLTYGQIQDVARLRLGRSLTAEELQRAARHLDDALVGLLDESQGDAIRTALYEALEDEDEARRLYDFLRPEQVRKEVASRLSLQALLAMQDSPSTEIERLQGLLRTLYGTVSTRSDWRRKWPVIDRKIREALIAMCEDSPQETRGDRILRELGI